MRDPQYYSATYVAADHSVRWRVVSPNGRTLGVSTTGFDTAAAAWGDLRLVQRMDGFVLKLTHPTSGVGWLWAAVGAHGRPVAEGCRIYGRRETCVVGYVRFTQIVGELALGDEEGPTRPTQPKRPSTYAAVRGSVGEPKTSSVGPASTM